MRDTEESSSGLTVTCAVLAQAIQGLIARHNCSPVEARERIEREAMAKRASLNDVARAIVVGETVSYRPNVSTRSEFARSPLPSALTAQRETLQWMPGLSGLRAIVFQLYCALIL